uniref:NADH-ubiquinone oxidoreductase chain 4L n=1 Tax=Stemonopa insignis TaxID=2020973 RepID=A0A3Q8BT24_9EUCA|nr:NADH dehydrogenase subunit 4L [Stemonopa insignis]
MMILGNLFLMVSLVMVVSGLWSFVLFRKHLLSTLLSLEFIMLGVFFLMGSCFLGMSMEVYFSLFFLALVVCEGALGLSLLVSIVRTHGNDYFSSFSMLKC